MTQMTIDELVEIKPIDDDYTSKILELARILQRHCNDHLLKNNENCSGCPFDFTDGRIPSCRLMNFPDGKMFPNLPMDWNL